MTTSAKKTCNLKDLQSAFAAQFEQAMSKADFNIPGKRSSEERAEKKQAFLEKVQNHISFKFTDKGQVTITADIPGFRYDQNEDILKALTQEIPHTIMNKRRNKYQPNELGSTSGTVTITANYSASKKSLDL